MFSLPLVLSEPANECRCFHCLCCMHLWFCVCFWVMRVYTEDIYQIRYSSVVSLKQPAMHFQRYTHW